MDGGPSHKDTFDLKPDSKGAGEFKPIKTSAPGVEISEHLPKLAKHDAPRRHRPRHDHPGGAHPRAKYNMHTGYREGQGGVVYPSHRVDRLARKSASADGADAELRRHRQPQLRLRVPRAEAPAAARHRPDPRRRGPEGGRRRPAVRQPASGLLEQMEKAFHREYQADAITDHKTTYERAVKLMQSKEAKAFDLSPEPSASRGEVRHRAVRRRRA